MSFIMGVWQDHKYESGYPAKNYLFKVNNKNKLKKWNMFKVTNEDARATLLTSFWCF